MPPASKTSGTMAIFTRKVRTKGGQPLNIGQLSQITRHFGMLKGEASKPIRTL